MSEIPIEYKMVRKTLQLDPKFFPECVTKQVEAGFIRKRILFVHRYADRWEILQLNPEPKSYTLY
jgi:hypothetical protein